MVPKLDSADGPLWTVSQWQTTNPQHPVTIILLQCDEPCSACSVGDFKKVFPSPFFCDLKLVWASKGWVYVSSKSEPYSLFQSVKHFSFFFHLLNKHYIPEKVDLKYMPVQQCNMSSSWNLPHCKCFWTVVCRKLWFFSDDIFWYCNCVVYVYHVCNFKLPIGKHDKSVHV